MAALSDPSSPTSFPLLTSVELDEIFTFKHEWEKMVRSRPTIFESRAWRLSCLTLWTSGRRSVAKQTFPTKFLMLLQSYSPSFAPRRSSPASLLRHEHWVPPASGAMFPSLVNYIINFTELVKALGIKEYAAVRILCSGLKGPSQQRSRLPCTCQQK